MKPPIPQKFFKSSSAAKPVFKSSVKPPVKVAVKLPAKDVSPPWDEPESVIENKNLDALKGQALIKLLKQADHVYFNTEDELLMSDAKYDQLYAKAKNQNPSDPYFKTVGAPQVSRDKVQLPIRMPGLAKHTPDTIGPYISNSGHVTTGNSLATDKIDGVSAQLIYFNGELQAVYTRGDDTEGRDITLHARHITGLPKTLKYFDGHNCCSGALTGAFAVRGELSIPRSTFASLKKKGMLITNKGKSTENEYSNPRSATVGLLNRQDSSDLLKYVVFVPFSIEESRIGLTVLEAWHELENLFEWPVFGKVIPTDLLNKPTEVAKLVTAMRTDSDFDCDGIVIALEAADSAMHNGERVAVKLAALDQAKLNGVRTTVKRVEITMSARNLAKPRIIIEPVEIDGVEIESITGDNMRAIEEYKVGPGSKVTVVRSGDVIPHIVKPDDKKDPDCITSSKTYQSITRCPDCNRPLKWTYTSKGVQGADLQCTDAVCLENKHAINFFIKLEAKDVGEANLGAVVDTLANVGVNGTVDQLLDETNLKYFCEALGDKKLGEKTFDALQDAMVCDHAKIMYASGAFATATQSLGADTLRKFLARLSCTTADLLEMDDANIAKALQGFHLTEGERLFARQMSVFAKFYDSIFDWHDAPKTTDQWKGRVYCFTGFRNGDAVDEIVRRGGRYVASMTKQVTHLVYGSASKKVEQAKAQGATLLTPHEFEKSMLKD